jgi:hypothetical protein
MPTFPKYLLITGILLGLTLTQIASAQSIKDIQNYCQSMGGTGLSNEDSKAFIDECIAEQGSYLEQEMPPEQYEESNSYDDNSTYEDNSFQEPQYEQEDYGQEQNCYAKVDEQIQKLLDSDPNSVFDYDQSVDQCLKGNF